jgi:PAS domain S-box-containing protein
MDGNLIHVLLVEDNEDDYMLISALLGQVRSTRYFVKRVSDFDGALLELQRNSIDVVLLDCLLGAKTGLDVQKHINAMVTRPPAILLTGHGLSVDLEAMKHGAADYIDKSQLRPDVLERSIRYSLEREKTKSLLRHNCMLKECGLAITQASGEEGLYQEICRIVVEVGGYMFCWVGLTDGHSFLLPVAHAGAEDGYLRNINVGSKNGETGQAQLGVPISMVDPFVIKDIGSDLALEPWRAEAIKRGYASSITLPLLVHHEFTGTLNIYSGETDAFDEEAVNLLCDLSRQLSLGISYFRNRFELVRTQQALQERVEFLRLLMDTIPNPIFHKNAELRYEGCNKAYEDLTGQKSEEIAGKNVFETGVVEIPENSHTMDLALLKRGGSLTYETTLKGGDGAVHYVLSTKAAYPDSEGKAAGIVGTWVDMTEQKKAEKNLQERERYFRSILANMHEDIFVIGPDYRISDVNRHFLETIKRKRKQIVGRPCYHVLLNARKPCFLDGKRCRLEEVFRTGAPDSVNGEMVRADGEKATVNVLYSPLRDETGKVVKGILAVRDISHEVRLELELRQAQKMEAIGTFAGGIAHDFNNIIGIILGYTELARFQLPPESPASSNLIQIQDACLRAKEVVKQILAFSRKNELAKHPVYIGFILKEALKLIRPALPATIEIKLDINTASGSDLILADATQMHQVIMNLSTNAADAMSRQGGTLEIDLSEISISSSDRVHFSDLTPGPYVCISFKDSGCGIEPSNIQRIFEPYFSTKGLSRGTGLGLAVVHGIVKEHKGQVKVYSELGKGSVFKIYLPAMSTISPVVEQGLNKPVTFFGTETILMVDDEKHLADVYSKLLNSLGYHTLAKTDSREALETFRNSPGSFDLVITDHTMPRMTGMDLARQILQIRPNMPIIICSGHNDSLNEHSARQAGIREFMIKPLLMQDLAGKIREVLDEGKKSKSN